MAELPVKSRWRRLLEFFNLTSVGPTIPLTKETNNKELGKYSNRELKRLNSRFISSQKDNIYNSHGEILPVQAIRPYLLETYNQLGFNKNTAKRLIALAPEIGRADSILTSSILSPNDLQKNDLNFECSIEGLEDDETLTTEINNLLNDHFNNNLKLNDKLPKWVSEILFESGAKAILCLPPQITDNMFDSLNPRQHSHESLQDTVNKLMNHDLFNNNDLLIANEQYNIQSSILDKSHYNQLISLEVFSAVKQACVSNEDLIDSGILKSPKILSSLINPLLQSFIDSNEELSLFKLSTNLDVLNYSTESKTLMRTKFNNALVKKFKGDERVTRYVKNTHHPIEEPIMSILDYCYKDKDLRYEQNKKIHPTLIELPTESVIPVCIPGSVSEHLGYFILLDEFGYPLSIRNELNNSNYCKPGTVDSSYRLLFNDLCSDRNINQTVMEQIFDHVFSTVTNFKLKSLGIENIKLIKYDDLNKVLFYRLLGKKRTNILFVPEILLTYFAFAYTDQGCGQSKLDDLKFALAVKTTLLMANMVASMNAAVDHHRIEVNIDPKETNPEKLLHDLREIYISNNLPVPSLNPWETANNVVRRSLQIVPKNIPGMTDFDVSVGSGEPRRGTTQVGSEVFDHINEMIKDGMGVPANALDKLPEEEYSRSVATNNILFARQLTEYQSVVIYNVSKIIRTYLSFDVALQTKLLEIIQKAPNIKDSKRFNMKKLIDNITLTLPSPQLAPDKSKFSEIKEFTDAIRDLTDMIYPEELDVDNESIKEGRKVMKAFFRQKATLTLIEKLGFMDMIPLDDITNFDMGAHFDDQLMMKNFAQLLAEIKDKIGNIGAESEDTSSSDMGSEGGDTGGEEGEEGGEEESFGDIDIGDIGEEDTGEEEGAEEGEEPEEETEEEPME
jgi:hypothetical protein